MSARSGGSRASTATGTWQVSLPCTRAEADAIAADIGQLALLEPPPALMTSEIDESTGQWRIDAFFERRPDAASLAMLRDLVPSATGTDPVVERMPDADWVTLSQAGLEPVRAGRFFVHTPAHRDKMLAGMIPLEIEAGLAFGTGQHETTTGCLLMLDALKRSGARFANLVDIGTGTGLLAFAAMKLWPSSRATASDIDPVAIAVTRDNAAVNRVATGRGPGQLDLHVASGLAHPALRRRGPHDLVIANILARPLIDLAPSIAASIAPRGTLILAGLLTSQANAVAAAYRRRGLMLADRIDLGDWAILRLRKRPRATGHNPASRG